MNPFDVIELDSKEVKKLPSEERRKGNPFDSEQFDESRWRKIARTLYQIPSGIGQAFSYPLDLIQMLGVGSALDEEELDQIRKISEREGIPFDEEKYMEALQQASEMFPTQGNIERGIEELTGAPLTPKTDLQKGLKLASTAGGFGRGTLPQRAVTGGKAVGIEKGLEELGVPESAAEFLGLAGSQLGPNISGGGPKISTKTKPSGLPERRFEKLKEPTEVSERKATQIHEKLGTDFKEISDKIISESPIGETFENLRNNPTYKQESRELLNESQKIADSLPGTIKGNDLKKEILDLSSKTKKGYLDSEYDKSYSKFINQIAKDTEKGNIKPGKLVEQYRKNNSDLAEYFEPGASKAYNRAKRDALLDHNRAIASFIEKNFPESELSSIFKEGNDRWSKIMNAETVDEFITDLTEGKINFKKGKTFFDDTNTERIFKKSFGVKYPKFEQLMKDMMSTEAPSKMLKIAKQKGFEDLYKTAKAFIVHPILGKGKLIYDVSKNTYKAFMNSLLDKPQLMITWDKGVKELKKGNFKAATKEFENLKQESEIITPKQIENSKLEKPKEIKEIEYKEPIKLEKPIESKEIEARKKALKQFKENAEVRTQLEKTSKKPIVEKPVETSKENVKNYKVEDIYNKDSGLNEFDLKNKEGKVYAGIEYSNGKNKASPKIENEVWIENIHSNKPGGALKAIQELLKKYPDKDFFITPTTEKGSKFIKNILGKQVNPRIIKGESIAQTSKRPRKDIKLSKSDKEKILNNQ